MGYRDEARAAEERLARLEAELAALAPPATSDLEEELAHLHERRAALTDEGADMSSIATPRPAKIAIYVAATLAIGCPLVPAEAAFWLVFAIVPAAIAAFVSAFTLIVRMRESRRRHTRRDRDKRGFARSP